jgi:hypothetical protein
VVTVTVKETGAPEVSVKLDGEIVQIAFAGALLQLRAAAPLNPGAPVNCKSYVAVPPLATVAEVELPVSAVKVNGVTPVP